MSQQAEKPLVSFLGPKASYTHQATLSQFPEQKYTLQGKNSIEEVFSAVQSKATPHGVVPFENSSNGPVGFTLDLFADTQAKYPDILVEAEVYLPVRHCLIGLHSQDTSSPTALSSPYSQITRLYSHPQAWTQCNNFLSTHFKGIERIDVSSTSRAAELVAQDTTKTSAAISSAIAASLNNLPILSEGIEDVKGNTTRFLVLRRKDSPPSFPPSSRTEQDSSFKTLISFKLRHHEQSGALAEFLSVFARVGLNLTSFHSRPSREAAWHYVFFLEVQGRREEDGESGKVNAALKEAERLVEEWRWLGSWENKRKV